MNPLIRLLASLCAICAITVGCSSASSPSNSPIAFVNVNVVPMDSERILEGYTVVVKGTRVVELGPTGTIELPEDATLIDGQGKFLMPGLAEMHGHIPSLAGENPDTVYALNTLFLYVAGGVTTVRGMLGGSGHLDLRSRANSGRIISPTLYLAGPALHGGAVESPDQAREQVRKIHAEGWDLIKVHEGLTAEEYDRAAATAHEVGIRFGGHVTNEISIEHAVSLGQETFDHMDGVLEFAYGDGDQLDPVRAAEIVELLRSSGSWVVPTLSLMGSVWSVTPLETMQAYPELAYVSKAQVSGWTDQYNGTMASEGWSRDQFAGYLEDMKQLLGDMNHAGAGILLGSDAPQRFSVPGFSLRHEMAMMVAAGMSPYEIYVTGTRNPGTYFQRSDSFGTIAPGRRADLVLLNANPLESVDNFSDKAGVMVRGRWLPWEDIQSRLDEIAALHENAANAADK